MRPRREEGSQGLNLPVRCTSHADYGIGQHGSAAAGLDILTPCYRCLSRRRKPTWISRSTSASARLLSGEPALLAQFFRFRVLFPMFETGGIST